MAINWEAIGAIGEVVGAIGVVVTLVYLAAQIRSNTKQLKFDSGQAVANSGDRGFDPIYTEPCMSIWLKGHADPNALSEAERSIFEALMVRQVHNFQNMIFAKDHDLLDEDTLRTTYAGFLRPLVHTPGGSEWFRSGKALFVKEVEELLNGDA